MTDTSRDSFNGKADKGEELPVWDLDALFGYDGYGSKSFETDYAKMEQMVQDFTAKYKGRIKTLDGDGLAQMLTEDRAIDELDGKMSTYVVEKQTQDVPANSQNTQTFQGRMAETHSDMVFLGDELKKISKKKMKQMLASSPALQKWEPVLDGIIKAKPHKLDPKVQKYLGEQGATGHLAGMHGRRQAALRYQLDGEELNTTQITKIINDDQDQAKRARAQAEFERVLEQEVWFNAEVHNGLIKFKRVSDRWSKFDNPPDAKHFANDVTPEMVDALEDAVKGAYERTSHRFYALKANLMDQESLNVYDRNVNIFEGEDEAEISWEEAKQIVLDAYYSFDQRAGEIAQMFFDNGWIDASVSQNKAGGAHAHPGAAALVNPLVMVNFQGTPGCVKTLAHELGHGIHQYLESQNPDPVSHAPLTIAETASVFGEMLTFKSLMARAENDDQRRKLLFEKIGDMLNTVVRQISFYDFEKRTHGQYKETKAPLRVEDFKKHWNDVAKESLGPSVKIEESYGPVFGYIPHIVRTPFYVYAYAFGDSLVNALWQVYEDEMLPEEEFKEKYFAMLEKGGFYKVEDLKTDFGLDVADPAFWQKGLDMMEGMIDELETLCEPLLEQEAKADHDQAPDAGQP